LVGHLAKEKENCGYSLKDMAGEGNVKMAEQSNLMEKKNDRVTAPKKTFYLETTVRTTVSAIHSRWSCNCSKYAYWYLVKCYPCPHR